MANALQWVIGSPWLYRQDFESGAEPSLWTHAGTPTYNSTPALLGAFSLQLDSVSTASYNPATSTYAEIYGFFLFKMTALPSVSKQLFEVFGVGNTELHKLFVLSTGELYCQDTVAAVAQTVATMSPNTLYYIWFRYKAGSGLNGIGSVAFSTNATEPSDPSNNFAKFTNGSRTQPANSFVFVNGFDAGILLTYDAFILNLTDVGSNPI